MVETAYDFVREIAAEGGEILFVGTKKQARGIEAEQEMQHAYVNQRWLGGMLTNYKTIKKRIDRLHELGKMEEEGIFDVLPKKEVIKLKHERDRLEKFLGGIKDMERIPDAIFVVDPRKERNAVREAQILGIPVVAIVDTNCDPDEIDYIIPGNDDAIRAVKLLTETMANAVLEGRQGVQLESADEEAVAVEETVEVEETEEIEEE